MGTINYGAQGAHLISIYSFTFWW